MNKAGLAILGVIAAIVLLANLGPMIALAICVVLLYFVLKGFLKAETTGTKIMWAVLGLIILVGTISNIPAIIGIVAAITLYYVYKNWNRTGSDVENVGEDEEDDPFQNFEKQWAEMNK